MNIATDRDADVPLIVDLDGTLVRGDTLHESFVDLLARRPFQALRTVLSIYRGRPAFKAALANDVLPDLATLPIDDTVIEAVRQARQQNRKVYLATAADKRVAEAVAESMGIFDGVFASDSNINLKGKAKADRLINEFGQGGYDYIGNSSADLPVWRAARKAFVAGTSRRSVARLNSKLPNAIVLGKPIRSAKAYLFALRPHQWLKNVLVGLPALAGHEFTTNGLFTVLLAFVSFSLCASSAYLINDMLDLTSDRRHAEKRHRPIAAGTVTVANAGLLFILALTISVLIALLLPTIFLFVLAGYFALTLAYSIYLKRKLMIDVVALAALYGIRVIAGGAATGIVLSQWLVGFCFFIFLSLALMKRTTELVLLPHDRPDILGRNYRRTDLPVINALTASSGFIGVLVLAFYINAPDVVLRYSHPDLLWGICIVLVFWLGRAFLLAGRGEMRQDPVVFAATDRVSLQVAAVIAGIFLAAL